MSDPAYLGVAPEFGEPDCNKLVGECGMHLVVLSSMPFI